MEVSQLVAVAVALAGAVVAVLLLLLKSARRQARVLAIIGSVLILLGVLARFAYQWMTERLLGRVDSDVIVSTMAADAVAGGVLTGAGLLLVTRAVAVAGQPAWTDRRGDGKPRRSGAAG